MGADFHFAFCFCGLKSTQKRTLNKSCVFCLKCQLALAYLEQNYILLLHTHTQYFQCFFSFVREAVKDFNVVTLSLPAWQEIYLIWSMCKRPWKAWNSNTNISTILLFTYLFLFIKGHDEGGCAMFVHYPCLGNEVLLPFLQTDGVNHAFFLSTLQTRFYHSNVGQINAQWDLGTSGKKRHRIVSGTAL